MTRDRKIARDIERARRKANEAYNAFDAGYGGPNHEALLEALDEADRALIALEDRHGLRTA